MTETANQYLPTQTRRSKKDRKKETRYQPTYKRRPSTPPPYAKKATVPDAGIGRRVKP